MSTCSRPSVQFRAIQRCWVAVLAVASTVLLAAGSAHADSQAAPTVTTEASLVADDTFSDTATLSEAPSGQPVPTGTATFDVYGPGNTTCAGTPLLTSTNPVNAAGTSATSDTFSPIQGPGTYQFIASYNGDSNYSSVTSRCGAAGESVTISPLVLSITMQTALVSLMAGPYAFSGAAILSGVPSGLPAPTGTVTFNVYGPIIYPFAYGPESCTGTPQYTSTNPVNSVGTSATSNMFIPPSGEEKLYLFTASYSGDAFYAPVTS
jgi:hypothetical protein